VKFCTGVRRNKSGIAIALRTLQTWAQYGIQAPSYAAIKGHNMHAPWPDTRLLHVLGIALPILQAPMAGAGLSALAAAVAEAGGLGALPCAMLTPEAAAAEIRLFRAQAARPLNLNFFCHSPPPADAAHDAQWRQLLRPYYEALGLDPEVALPAAARKPFDAAMCALVEAERPAVVSFHFGLPAPALLERVKATGAKVLSSATTVREAVWLEARGCDAIIAQGVEAGGHRGMFLSQDIGTQLGTMALVPQIVDAVQVPVIAAGGIGDARGIAAAFALGAAGVQLGTVYLLCPEATISPVHRAALQQVGDDDTALTRLFSGRPARGIVNRLMRDLGPMNPAAPAFPLAGAALAPLRAQTEPSGIRDFMPLWAGQARRYARALPAAVLTQRLAEETLQHLRR
jgi:nitronate monooxygenase